MEREPTLLFLDGNQGYAVAKVDSESLQKITEMYCKKHDELTFIPFDELSDIIHNLETKCKGPQLTFQLKNYGASIPVHINLPRWNMNKNDLVRRLEGFFSKPKEYASKCNVNDVVVQKLDIKIVGYPEREFYEMIGYAQLLIPDTDRNFILQVMPS